MIGAERVTETALGRCKCFVVLFFVIVCLFFLFCHKNRAADGHFSQKEKQLSHVGLWEVCFMW